MSTSELVTVNADSSRACLACGHAVPHSRGEYEDSHLRCMHSTPVKYGCGVHGTWKSGARKGDQRFSQKCADRIPSGCFIGQDWCECSEEDRRIAELTKALTDIHYMLAGVALIGAGVDWHVVRDITRSADNALTAPTRDKEAAVAS